MPAEGRFSVGANGQPTEIHHRDGHWFMVEEVLCHHTWRDGTCWRMRVWGALPGNPTARGHFIMIALQTGPLGRCIIGRGECECTPPL
jgi:hypothetical protein